MLCSSYTACICLAPCFDADRTFPHHPYFKKSSGRGQTALYNVLKAYSVLDKEVGYCQGLGFIAGLFVIHVRPSYTCSTCNRIEEIITLSACCLV